VKVENFVHLLTGHLPPGTPRSKQLRTDERVIYWFISRVMEAMAFSNFKNQKS